MCGSPAWVLCAELAEVLVWACSLCLGRLLCCFTLLLNFVPRKRHERGRASSFWIAWTVCCLSSGNQGRGPPGADIRPFSSTLLSMLFEQTCLLWVLVSVECWWVPPPENPSLPLVKRYHWGGNLEKSWSLRKGKAAWGLWLESLHWLPLMTVFLLEVISKFLVLIWGLKMTVTFWTCVHGTSDGTCQIADNFHYK